MFEERKEMGMQKQSNDALPSTFDMKAINQSRNKNTLSMFKTNAPSKDMKLSENHSSKPFG